LNLVTGGSQKTGLVMSVFDTYNNQMKESKFLSGGDKAAIGFALRVGISDLMRRIRPTKESPKKNPKIDFLILDEPLGSLDMKRREEILTTLQSQDLFSQIFLITHTRIPEDIDTHAIKIIKNFETGLSTAKLVINQKLL
ncbi:MAG: P-loop NTPase family protein, partial [Candidatus Helarchaeales archaeon]